MMKPVFIAVDDAWKKEFSPNYKLSLLIGIGYLQYCILDSAKKKYLSIGVFSFPDVNSSSELNGTLKEIFSENEIFQQTYQSVHAAVSHNISTLVPKDFFEEDKTADYLNFNHQPNSSDRIFADDIATIQTKNIYSYNGELLILLNEYFANVIVHHSSSSLIEVLLKENSFCNEARMFANISDKKMELVVVQKGKLIFYNSFQFQTPEDFIYFVLFVCEQLKLNPDTLNFYFIGEIERKSALYDIAYKYIRNVNFGRRPNAYNYSYKFAFFPSHFYFNIFCLGSF